MKTKHFVLSLILVLPGLALAQDDPNKPVKRPENIGVSDFDSFKNSSFDILDESTQLKNDVTRLDTDIKSYAGGIASVSLEKLKADYKALKDLGQSSQALTTKIGGLDEKGKELLASAKTINPRTKAPAASNNTNKSIKGLETARKNLDGVSSVLQENVKLLSAELKSRGENVD
jgi:hypothetical protein